MRGGGRVVNADDSAVTFQAVGECMVEIVRDGTNAHFGYSGDTYNAAVYLRRVAQRYGVDVDVRYLSAVGDDAESGLMRDQWRAEGISDDAVVVPGRSLGLYLIHVDADGERSFSYWRSESAAASMFTETDWVHRVSGAMVYLSGITLQLMSEPARTALIARLRDLRAHGTRVVFDSNYRQTGWSSKGTALEAMTEVLALTDIALVTFEDEQELSGCIDVHACVARLRALGVDEIVVKDGANGAWIWTSALELVETVPVDATDTTAAGDSFNGGYLAARLAGMSLREAAEVGNAVAGAVVVRPGAIVGLDAMPESVHS